MTGDLDSSLAPAWDARCVTRQLDRGMGPDLARPGVLLVHCAGAMGLGFATVVTSDTETKPQPTPPLWLSA